MIADFSSNLEKNVWITAQHNLFEYVFLYNGFPDTNMYASSVKTTSNLRTEFKIKHEHLHVKIRYKFSLIKSEGVKFVKHCEQLNILIKIEDLNHLNNPKFNQ